MRFRYGRFSAGGYESVQTPPSRLRPPRHNVICGHLYDDETICRQPAGPDHTHDAPPLRDPAPGLFEQVTGKPLPSYTELRAVYGDPADLPPILPEHRPALEEFNQRAREALGGISGAEAVRRVAEGAAALREAVGSAATKVDFRDMLRDDDQPWSPRSRLTVSLGRPALATRLADALPPALAAELADRLDTLVTQAVTEREAHLTQEISDRYHEARARIEADAAEKLREVHDERYRGHSRLS